eukprot:g32955.t1
MRFLYSVLRVWTPSCYHTRACGVTSAALPSFSGSSGPSLRVEEIVVDRACMFNQSSSLMPMGVLGGLPQQDLWAPQPSRHSQSNPPPFNPPSQPPLYNPQTQQTFTQGNTYDRPSASNTYASVWTDEKVVDSEDRILIDGLEPHEIPQSARLWIGGLNWDTSEQALLSLWIGGLNWDTSEQALLSYFSYFGKVLQVNIMRDKRTGRSRGFGFIVFERTTSVDKVMEERARIHIDGRKITCERALHKHEMDSMESQNKFKKVFVGGLNPQSTEESLRQHFKNYGKLEDVLIVRNRTGGRSRGFGFITYGEFEDVDCVMESEHVVDGFLVECKRAVPNRYKTDEQGNASTLGMTGMSGEAITEPGSDRKRGDRGGRKKGNRGGDNQRGSAGATLSSLTPSVSWEVQNVAVQPQTSLNIGSGGLSYGLSPLAGMGGAGGMYPGLGQGNGAGLGGGMVGGGMVGIAGGQVGTRTGGSFHAPVLMPVPNQLNQTRPNVVDRGDIQKAMSAQPVGQGIAGPLAGRQGMLNKVSVTPGGAVPVGPAIITTAGSPALGMGVFTGNGLRAEYNMGGAPSLVQFQRAAPYSLGDMKAIRLRQSAGIDMGYGVDARSEYVVPTEPISLSDSEKFNFVATSDPRFYPTIASEEQAAQAGNANSDSSSRKEVSAGDDNSSSSSSNYLAVTSAFPSSFPMSYNLPSNSEDASATDSSSSSNQMTLSASTITLSKPNTIRTIIDTIALLRSKSIAALALDTRSSRLQAATPEDSEEGRRREAEKK